MRLEFRPKNFVNSEAIVTAKLCQRMFQGDPTSGPWFLLATGFKHTTACLSGEIVVRSDLHPSTTVACLPL